MVPVNALAGAIPFRSRATKDRTMIRNLPANVYQPMVHKFQPETVTIIATIKRRCPREAWISGWEILQLHHFLDEHTNIREAIAEAMKE